MRTSHQRTVIMTVTGELFLPSRIVYRVSDAKRLVQKFRKLRCMTFDRLRGRWTWNYEHEAKALGFPIAYDALPPEAQPVVLASCYLPTPSTLHVYVRCTRRVAKFMEFFDRVVPRACAQAEYLDQCNFVTTVAPDEPIPVPEDFFRNESEIEFLDWRERAPTKGAADEERERWLRELEERFLPALDRRPLEAFYADGPESIEQAMQLREILAWKQHQAGKPIRPYDVILEIIQNSDANWDD